VDNINVDGLLVVGVIQGFGQLWRKTYQIRLEGAAVTPAEVIAVWKQRFASFWPADSRFHSPQGGLAPGVVVLLDQLLPGHLRLSSGVMLLYADEVSFTVMTAQGHPLAGWNTPRSSYGVLRCWRGPLRFPEMLDSLVRPIRSFKCYCSVRRRSR
jgi:hypothetical protein